ncbi:MAG: hypothetical protein HW386_1619, partial [Gammaproteobacteria bacterium]|nr:hypothetical protein [Gammaproteobacteria bacterium]
DKEVRPQKVRMREQRKPSNDINYSLTLQALTPAMENQFPTFSTDCILAIVSRGEREFSSFCDSLIRKWGKEAANLI